MLHNEHTRLLLEIVMIIIIIIIGKGTQNLSLLLPAHYYHIT